MSESLSHDASTIGTEAVAFIRREKRNAQRKPARSFVTVRLTPARIEGVGSNQSQTGAYFVTCDEIPVEIVLQEEGEERRIDGTIVRIDSVTEGSYGVAVRYDTRQMKS